MRFNIAAALLVGLVAAGGKPKGSESDSIVYSTKEFTKTQCPPEITDCPAESKTVHVITSIIADTTTYCPEEASETANSPPPPPPSSKKSPPPPPASSKPCEACVVTVTLPHSASPPPSNAPYPVPNNTTKPVPVGTTG
jgi:hypothetical protein